MSSGNHDTVFDGLDAHFSRVLDQLDRGQRKVQDTIRGTAEKLRAAAKAKRRQQLVRSLQAQLQAAQQAYDEWSADLRCIEEQLSRHKTTLNTISSDASNYDPEPVIAIKDSVDQLGATLMSAIEVLEVNVCNETELVTSVHVALKEEYDDDLADALEHYISSRDTSSAAKDAARCRHTEVCGLCDEVGVAVAERAFAANQFECPICRDEHSVEDKFFLSTCGHFCCRGCADHWARSQLNDGQIPKCSVLDCKQPWAQGDLRVLDETLLLSYCAVEIHDYVRHNQCYKCLHCNMAVERPPGDAPLNLHLQCPMCGKESCLACQVDWHENSTCEQYQKWKKDNEGFDDKALKKWLKDNRGRVHKMSAGGCGNAVLKDACNSVWCSACKYYFCWFCLKRIAEAGDSNEKRHQHFGDPGPCFGKCWEEPKWDDEDS